MQKNIFVSSEGDNWYDRNKNSYINKSKNKIVKSIKDIEYNPKKVLEIGCSDGYLLKLINLEFKSECYGIDPSAKAIEEGSLKYQNVNLFVGTADKLDFENSYFDIIIIGFCLYLCDRQDLFKIAYEVDRCLCNNGIIIIKDFYPPFPYKNEYIHFDNIYSFKMDYSRMFLWNPNYYEIYKKVFTHDKNLSLEIPNERINISILKKNEIYAYPNNPF